MLLGQLGERHYCIDSKYVLLQTGRGREEHRAPELHGGRWPACLPVGGVLKKQTYKDKRQKNLLIVSGAFKKKTLREDI